MLLLQRRVGESIFIGDDIKITVLDASHRQVRIGIQAPRDVEVHREEIYQRIQLEKAGQSASGKTSEASGEGPVGNAADSASGYTRSPANLPPGQAAGSAGEYPRITNKKDIFKNRAAHPFRRNAQLKRGD